MDVEVVLSSDVERSELKLVGRGGRQGYKRKFCDPGLRINANDQGRSVGSTLPK